MKELDDTFASVSFASTIAGVASTSAASAAENGFAKGPIASTAIDTTSLVTIETDRSQQVQNRLRTGSVQAQRFLR